MSARLIDRLLLGGIGVLLVALVAVFANSINEHVIKEGDTAPEFSLTTDSGRTITRAGFGGKLLLVNFWATWCEPCVTEMPSLDRLQKRFAAQGLVVLGISIDKDARAYGQFLKRVPVSFQTARDAEQKINTQYGTLRVPESYIIDPSGRVLKKIVGAERWDDDRVMSYVQSLL